MTENKIKLREVLADAEIYPVNEPVNEPVANKEVELISNPASPRVAERQRRATANGLAGPEITTPREIIQEPNQIIHKEVPVRGEPTPVEVVDPSTKPQDDSATESKVEPEKEVAKQEPSEIESKKTPPTQEIVNTPIVKDPTTIFSPKVDRQDESGDIGEENSADREPEQLKVDDTVTGEIHFDLDGKPVGKPEIEKVSPSFDVGVDKLLDTGATKKNGQSNADRAKEALVKNPPIIGNIKPAIHEKATDQDVPVRQVPNKVDLIKSRIANGGAESEVLGRIEPTAHQPEVAEQPKSTKPNRHGLLGRLFKKEKIPEVVGPAVSSTFTSPSIKEPVPDIYKRDRTGEGEDPHDILKRAKWARQKGGQKHMDTETLNGLMSSKKVEEEKKGFVETEIEKERKAAELNKAA